MAVADDGGSAIRQFYVTLSDAVVANTLSLGAAGGTGFANAGGLGLSASGRY